MPHPAPTSAQDSLEPLQFALVVVFLSSPKQNISDTRDGHHLHKHCVAVLVVCSGGIVYIRLCGWVWMVLVAYCAYIYKCVEVCGGPCTNVYMCTKCGRRCLCWCV